jgi:molybdate transport system substrate-binding protein
MTGKAGRVCMAALLLLVAFSSTLSAATRKEITVSAAISLKNTFEEIGRYYESRNRGTKIMFNFGASGDLMRQIEAGAPVDVFASASPGEMDELEKRGLTTPGSRLNFALNTVVLVFPSDAKASVISFSQLRSESIRTIAVGNPKTVPAGRYAEEVFSYYKMLDAIQAKLIFTGNVRQVLDYVARREVDAGVVYSTDAIARAKEVEIVATAPGQSHRPVVYPIAVVKGTKNVAAAEAFISLVASDEGKKILKKYGFAVGK